MIPNPKISVITPSLNKGKYTQQAIESVIQQRYRNVEHIIVDGGSTDETLDILIKYKKYKHIKLYIEKNSNFIEALNTGVGIANGDIISILNSDDYYEPRIFDRVVKIFNQDAKIHVIVGNLNVVDAKGNITRVSKPVTTLQKILQPWWYEFPLNPSSYFYKNVHNKLGLFNSSVGLNEDYEFLIRLAQQYSFVYVDQTFGNWRYYFDSKTYKNRANALNDAIKVSKKFHGSFKDINFYWYRFSYLRYLIQVKMIELFRGLINYTRKRVRLRTRIATIRRFMSRDFF